VLRAYTEWGQSIVGAGSAGFIPAGVAQCTNQCFLFTPCDGELTVSKHTRSGGAVTIPEAVLLGLWDTTRRSHFRLSHLPLFPISHSHEAGPQTKPDVN